LFSFPRGEFLDSQWAGAQQTFFTFQMPLWVTSGSLRSRHPARPICRDPIKAD
jgi:hypothetical protein